MKAAFGRRHKGGLAAFAGKPTFVEIIMADKMSPEYVCVCLCILRRINNPPPCS